MGPTSLSMNHPPTPDGESYPKKNPTPDGEEDYLTINFDRANHLTICRRPPRLCTNIQNMNLIFVRCSLAKAVPAIVIYLLFTDVVYCALFVYLTRIISFRKK